MRLVDGRLEMTAVSAEWRGEAEQLKIFSDGGDIFFPMKAAVSGGCSTYGE
jgi:hypothetical protein